MMGFDYYQPFGFFGPFLMIIWWILFLAGIIALVRWLTGESGGRATNKDKVVNGAIDIIKERYAKGEIDKKEFEIKKKDLLD